MAGEQYDDDAVDYFLQKRLGAAAMFISATSIYDIDLENNLATSLHDVQGGLLARFEGLYRLPVAQSGDVRNQLALVADTAETLACFSTIDADISSIRRLRQRKISIGSQLPMVGYALDQPIEVESLQAILHESVATDHSVSPLRLIK
jgi:hypothetical protein